MKNCCNVVRCSAPLVLMAGVGQRVEGSVLSDAPQTAVYVQGNSHKLLNSTIRDVLQQCNDVRASLCLRVYWYPVAYHLLQLTDAVCTAVRCLLLRQRLDVPWHADR